MAQQGRAGEGAVKAAASLTESSIIIYALNLRKEFRIIEEIQDQQESFLVCSLHRGNAPI